jgi:hypothetical protein
MFFRFSELGVLCVSGARPMEYRLDRGRAVCPERYSTGRVIILPTPQSRIHLKISNTFGYDFHPKI